MNIDNQFMGSFLIAAARAALGLAFVGCLLIQSLLPRIAQDTGGGYRETASLVGPYSMVAIFAVACVQIALAIIWRLLSMVSSHSVFSLPAVHWFNGLTLCLALAAVLPSAVLFHLLFVVRVGGPGILLVFGTVVIAGLAVLMLMLVLRRLLITAAVQLEKLGLEI